MVAANIPQQTMFKAVVDALTPDAVVANRVYRDRAPAKRGSSPVRPYFVFILAGNNQQDVLRFSDSYEFLLTVKCVDNDYDVAIAGAQRINAALADQGAGDRGGSNLVTGDSVWVISAITPERVIDFTEDFEGAETIFHVGFQYLITLDENT